MWSTEIPDFNVYFVFCNSAFFIRRVPAYAENKVGQTDKFKQAVKINDQKSAVEAQVRYNR